MLLRKYRLKPWIGKIAIGSIGKGIKKSQNSEITKLLKKSKIFFQPYELTVPDISQKMQNAIVASYDFVAIKDDIKKLGDKIFQGKEIAWLIGASGGGNGQIAALSAGIDFDFPGQFIGLDFYISEETTERYGGGVERIIRRRINTYIQLATIYKQIEKVKNLYLEFYTMPTMLKNFNSYENVDKVIFQTDVIITGCEKFGDLRGSLTEILGRPDLKYFTRGYYEITIKERPEVMTERIRDAIRYKIYPFFDSKILEEENVIGNPVIFIAGYSDAIKDGLKIVNAEFMNPKNIYKFSKDGDTIFSEIDSANGQNEVSISDIFTWPIPNCKKIYIVALYPLNKEKIKNIFERSRKKLLEIKEKADRGEDDLFSRTYNFMRKQAGGDRLLWEILIE